MIHAVAYIVFILPFTAWLGYELKRKYLLRTYWPWLLAAFVVGIAGSILSQIYPGKLGNFLLHASGGFSCALLFVYLIKTLQLKFSHALNIALLFAFVCTLGVLNELAEYAFELLGLGTLSLDTQDTWRDFVANTIGAATLWIPYIVSRQIRTTKQSELK